MKWNLIRRVLCQTGIGIITFALAGCFTSENPFITPDNADYPFQSITFVNVGEPAEEEEQITIIRNGDTYVEQAEGDDSQYHLVRIALDMYVAQLAEEGYKGKVKFLYGVVQIENGTTMNILNPTCEHTPEDILAAVSIEKTDKQFTGECKITSLDQMIDLARLLVKTDIKREVYRIIKLVE